jgi:hypothetical protein
VFPKSGAIGEFPGFAKVEHSDSILYKKAIPYVGGSYKERIYAAMTVRQSRRIGRQFVYAGMRLAEFEINGFDVADVAILDFFVMVILDLRDFVADGKGRPDFLDLWVSSRIESPLQLDIQGTGSVPVACPYLVILEY